MDFFRLWYESIITTYISQYSLMIITYQTDNKDTVQISSTDNRTFRIWGTHGVKWREYNATLAEAPNILTFVQQFQLLADTLIENIR